MDRKLQSEAEKENFYWEVINKADNRNIIIYGASIIAKEVFQELKNRGREVSAFCVSNKNLNRREIEQRPVWQVDELLPEICRNSFFILAMKLENQNQIQKTLKEKGIKDYIGVPENLCSASVNLQRIYIPGIEITTKIGCSVNCRYCPQDILCRNYIQKHKETMLSFQNFKLCLNKMPQNSYILFSGFVEPFLNPECIEMLEYSVEKGYITSLNTTLVGMSKEQAERLVKLPIKFFTLHTPDIDEYANIPMTKEYWEILDLLLNSKKKDGSPFIDIANCQSMPHPQVVKFINNRVSFSNLVLIDRAGNLEKTEIYENINHIGSIFCTRSSVLNRNVLLPNGTVVLCCMDFGLQHELGNLLHHSYEEIINGQAMQEIKMNMENGKEVLCRKCSFAKQII